MKTPLRPALTMLCLGLAALAFGAAPASATRVYDSQITGVGDVRAATVDILDNLWISDGGSVSKYSPYPSQTLFRTQKGGGSGLAVSSADDRLFIATSEDAVDIYDKDGAFLSQLSYGFNGFIFVAADNSLGPSGGRIYVASANADQARAGVQVFDSSAAFDPSGTPVDANGNPVKFSASGDPAKPYIKGNGLTGTPNGPFEKPWNITVDRDGNIYVLDFFASAVDQFDSSGTFVREFTDAEVPGGFSPSVAGGGLTGVAVDPNTGNVLIVDAGNDVIHEFDSSGSYVGQLSGTTGGPFGGLATVGGGIAFNSEGYLYVADPANQVIDIFSPAVVLPKVTGLAASSITRGTASLSANADPNGASDITDCHFDYGTDIHDHIAACLDSGNNVVGTPSNPITAATDVHADLTGLSGGTTYHFRLSLTGANGTQDLKHRAFTTPPAVLDVITGPASDITNVSATLNGSYTGDGNDTNYYFKYGTSISYGQVTAVPPGVNQGTGTGTQDVSAGISGLLPNTTYHYALVATNSFGSTTGPDQAFTTPQKPTIEGFTSSNITDTSADLNAWINPQGFETTYHFEYGPTTAYGASAPVPDASIGSGSATQSVTVHLKDLLPRTTYHFRLIAQNQWGTVTTGDQTFDFFPPICPNATLRQQTGSAYLPDCRAYELVSPPDAQGTMFFPGGPNSGYATNPSRLSFAGLFGSIPGADNPINAASDLHVSTRTDTGWVTRYVGPSADQVACTGGPPAVSFNSSPDKLSNGILTNRNMDTFVNWNDGNPDSCGSNKVLNNDWNTAAEASNAPYIWTANGNPLGRWPTNLETVSEGRQVFACPEPPAPTVAPGAFGCTTNITASGDLTHFVFSTASGAFGEGGLTAAPGSAYDNNIVHDTLTLISKTPSGADIAQEPGNTDPNEILQFPDVSADGSRILMATDTEPRCIQQGFHPAFPRCQYLKSPVHLYMRVNGTVTYDVSDGHTVTYVDMTPDGSKVYFISDQQITPDDHDTSTDLFMWSLAGNGATALTRLSTGDAGAGDTDSCSASWTARCGVVMYSNDSFSQLPGGRGGLGIQGGSGLTDNALAAVSGDIYFYSPEQLDGARGVGNQYNFYVYRDGHAQYVTTLTGGVACSPNFKGVGTKICSDGPVARLQVSPDGSHAAFITTSRITSYDNAGFTEMYTYEPDGEQLLCVSCRPSGEPPTSDVLGSQGGLFMTNDGRTFFSTTDALVSRDTNEGRDVYEFVGGRPQLITTGTGTAQEVGGACGFCGASLGAVSSPPGLYGVSANGRDVYFSTLDTLVGQDQNGNQIKFYDARTNGGFLFNPPVAPCAAADECHDSSGASPGVMTNGTGAALGAGMSRRAAKQKLHRTRRHRKQRQRKHRHRSRTKARSLGGSR